MWVFGAVFGVGVARIVLRSSVGSVWMSVLRFLSGRFGGRVGMVWYGGDNVGSSSLLYMWAAVGSVQLSRLSMFSPMH